MVRIYLDVCCLCRPFDDQTQESICKETEALFLIWNRQEQGLVKWITSDVVVAEINATPDIGLRTALLKLITRADEMVKVSDEVIRHAKGFRGKGISDFDALHLALARKSHCDILLTTDYDLLKKANKLDPPLALTVMSPVYFVEKGYDHEGT